MDNVGCVQGGFFMFTEVLIALTLFSISLLGGSLIALRALDDAKQSLQTSHALNDANR